MRIMIHACPVRMWYVNGYIIPELKSQGADDITVWQDDAGRGNLTACMDAFKNCEGDGGTWHLQDDILLSRDFVERASQMCGEKIVCGFVNEVAGPNCNIRGEAYMADMWYSFPCIYIPNQYARECAEWFFSGRWKADAQSIADTLYAGGSGDDFFFREFMETHHGGDTVLNLTPCLVDHVDWLVGGSTVNRYRGFLSRAVYWEDDSLLDELKKRIDALRR